MIKIIHAPSFFSIKHSEYTNSQQIPPSSKDKPNAIDWDSFSIQVATPPPSPSEHPN